MIKPSPRRSGRKEILTLELANKIAKLIERMPDAELPVTWANIEYHVKKTLGHELKRNVLSSKSFGDRKPIFEAYTLAKDVEKRLQKQGAPKYVNSSRAALRQNIQRLETKVLALQQQLDTALSAQLTTLDLFRATRLDLRALTTSEGKGLN